MRQHPIVPAAVPHRGAASTPVSYRLNP